MAAPDSSVVALVLAGFAVVFIGRVYNKPYDQVAKGSWQRWIRDKLHILAYKMDTTFTRRNLERTSKQLGWRVLVTLVIAWFGYYIGSVGILGEKLAFFINVNEARLKEFNKIVEDANKENLRTVRNIERRVSLNGNMLLTTLKSIYGLQIETALVEVPQRAVDALNANKRVTVTARLKGNFKDRPTVQAITSNIKYWGRPNKTDWPGVRQVRCSGSYCAGELVAMPDMPAVRSLEIFWIAWGHFPKADPDPLTTTPTTTMPEDLDLR